MPARVLHVGVDAEAEGQGIAFEDEFGKAAVEHGHRLDLLEFGKTLEGGADAVFFAAFDVLDHRVEFAGVLEVGGGVIVILDHRVEVADEKFLDFEGEGGKAAGGRFVIGDDEGFELVVVDVLVEVVLDADFAHGILLV